MCDHAYADSIASFKGAASLAQRIDGAFDPLDAEDLCGMQDAAAGLAAEVRPEAAIDLGAAGVKQKLSRLCLTPQRRRRTSSLLKIETGFIASTSRSRRCMGAGVWLTACRRTRV